MGKAFIISLKKNWMCKKIILFLLCSRCIDDESSNVFIGVYVSVESAEDGGAVAQNGNKKASASSKAVKGGGMEVRWAKFFILFPLNNCYKTYF